MRTKKFVLDFDLPEFYEVLTFVSGSLTGDFGVQELEKQVLAISETAPFLTKLLAAAGEAQRQMEGIRDLPPEAFDDPEIAQQFIHHNEIFCCLQGSMATLMVVSQILKKQNASPPRTRKRKKS